MVKRRKGGRGRGRDGERRDGQKEEKKEGRAIFHLFFFEKLYVTVLK